MALPLFLNYKNKYLVLFLLFIVGSLQYLSSNHFQFFDPIYLPMSKIDAAVPFIPQTIWIYMSEYILFPTVYLMSKDLKNCNKYLYAFFAQQTTACIIFLFWPTIYPRHLFPLPEDMDALSYFLFSSLRSADAPTNCCPSLHVSSVFLSSFIFLNEQKEKFPFFFIWAILIAASTLTTKQHYLIDVTTGFLFASITFWIFYNIVQYKPLPSFAEEAIEPRGVLGEVEG